MRYVRGSLFDILPTSHHAECSSRLRCSPDLSNLQFFVINGRSSKHTWGAEVEGAKAAVEAIRVVAIASFILLISVK